MEMEKLRRVYSNLIGIEVSAMDFRLIFGLRDLQQAKKGEYDLVGDIFISPQHAKAFALMLMENVQMYEQHFGEINLPARDLDEQIPN